MYIKNKSDVAYRLNIDQMNVHFVSAKKIAEKFGPSRLKPWLISLSCIATGIAPIVYVINNFIIGVSCTSGLILLPVAPFLGLVPVGCITGISMGISNNQKRKRLKEQVQECLSNAISLPGETTPISIYVYDFSNPLNITLLSEANETVQFNLRL